MRQIFRRQASSVSRRRSSAPAESEFSRGRRRTAESRWPDVATLQKKVAPPAQMAGRGVRARGLTRWRHRPPQEVAFATHLKRRPGQESVSGSGAPWKPQAKCWAARFRPRRRESSASPSRGRSDAARKSTEGNVPSPPRRRCEPAAPAVSSRRVSEVSRKRQGGQAHACKWSQCSSSANARKRCQVGIKGNPEEERRRQGQSEGTGLPARREKEGASHCPARQVQRQRC